MSDMATWVYAGSAFCGLVLTQITVMVRGFVALERRLTRIEDHLEIGSDRVKRVEDRVRRLETVRSGSMFTGKEVR